MEKFSLFLEHELISVGSFSLNVLGLLQIILVILLAYMVTHLVRRSLKKYLEDPLSPKRNGAYVVTLLVKYTMVSLAAFLVITIMGIDLHKLTLIIGALSVGIGLGLQGIINNFVSGILLLFEGSIKVGDFIELENGPSGVVTAIRVRSTEIRNSDNIDIVVPNSSFISGRFTNYTMHERIFRVHIPFGVAYGTDKDLVQRVVIESAKKAPFTLKDDPGREPDVWMVGMGESSLDFELVTWVDPQVNVRPGRIRATLTWLVHSALVDNNIVIPFPQRDLHVIEPVRARVSSIVEEDAGT